MLTLLKQPQSELGVSQYRFICHNIGVSSNTLPPGGGDETGALPRAGMATEMLAAARSADTRTLLAVVPRVAEPCRLDTTARWRLHRWRKIPFQQ